MADRRAPAAAPARAHPYSSHQVDSHFHFKSFSNLREKMLNVCDDYDALMRQHGDSAPVELWNSMVALKQRFDEVLCCVGCNEYLPRSSGDVRVMKCGHECHKSCYERATVEGKCTICNN